ncbi:50S ribosomal protein L18 [Bernardetia sp.]|uniref:50S ribosomal protein L18 n=1 Tax=Bernardetia sp. TaxID=1937974 RepID=UPI0025B7AF2C|nr:50S ribosomal protein L18 [Bernardetia sp.]
MATTSRKSQRRTRIRRSIRKKLAGTAERPRLSVFRSNKYIYTQLIDDVNGRTLVSASLKDIDAEKHINQELSKQVGSKLAERAKEKGIDKVVFDRNGFLYHGNIKAVAEGAREGGLQF